MSWFSTYSYFGNGVEELCPCETVSTPMKLSAPLSSLIQCHVIVFNTASCVYKPLHAVNCRCGRYLKLYFKHDFLPISRSRVKEYLPITGLAEFNKLSAKLIFGADRYFSVWLSFIFLTLAIFVFQLLPMVMLLTVNSYRWSFIT